ncbi:putative inositol-3-phosphate synthase protein [Eutypa lata UCREL1]|uniref:Putative inositol-3-phosphate synthase protein n=1 Tax=Eutypa lata (strain UCR-EL1) TaxID=1287681 RepID=M7SSQ2_EUTLA|nr:putative inositol-3-phosphate synthase protein [Eutypa lata UCREL1]
MAYSVIIFAYRKPGTTPEQLKAHYENSHVPPGQAESSTERNATTPASVLIGSQADFDYDAFAELVFKDETAFQTFMGVMQKPENAAEVAADEEQFLDRSKMTVVLVGDTTTTTNE